MRRQRVIVSLKTCDGPCTARYCRTSTESCVHVLLISKDAPANVATKDWTVGSV